MIRIVRGPEPRGLKTARKNRLSAAVSEFDQHGAPSRQLTAKLIAYGTRATKIALHSQQYGKCAWCERLIDFSSSPVEHYRPKDGAWRNGRSSPRVVDASHYWWLTWSWSNLLISCVRCNDAGHKANHFPLKTGTKASAKPSSPVPRPLVIPLVNVSQESPLLLDPAGGVNPLDHIEWRPNNTAVSRRDWTWTPIGKTDIGRSTIEILKLDELASHYQDHVVSRLLPSVEEAEQHLNATRTSEAKRRWSQLLDDTLLSTKSMSAFTWYALQFLAPKIWNDPQFRKATMP